MRYLLLLLMGGILMILVFVIFLTNKEIRDDPLLIPKPLAQNIPATQTESPIFEPIDLGGQEVETPLVDFAFPGEWVDDLQIPEKITLPPAEEFFGKLDQAPQETKPEKVILRSEQEFPLLMDGQEVGKALVPEKTILKVSKVLPSDIEVIYQGAKKTIPSDITDYIEQFTSKYQAYAKSKIEANEKSIFDLQQKRANILKITQERKQIAGPRPKPDPSGDFPILREMIETPAQKDKKISAKVIAFATPKLAIIGDKPYWVIEVSLQEQASALGAMRRTRSALIQQGKFVGWKQTDATPPN